MPTYSGEEQINQSIKDTIFKVRPLNTEDESDLEALIRLYNEADAEYQIGLINGRESLDAGLRDKRQVLTPNPLLVVENPEMHGEFVGTLSLEPKLESGRNLFFMHGLVHPAWTGRGVGVRLMQEALKLAPTGDDEISALVEPVAPELPINIVFTVSGSIPRPEELAHQFGLFPERYYIQLYRDDLDNISMPELPPQFSLRSFQNGDENEYTAAFNDSYFSNWGYSPATVERVVYGWQKPPTDNEKLLLIWDDEAHKIVAFARLRVRPETTKLHNGRGEIAWIGTRSGYQHQGIGRAILIAALLRLRDKYGFKGAAVVVDVPAANPEPVLHFFKHAGFREEIERRITICRREI